MSGLEPATYVYAQLPDGGARVTLPNGATRTYSQDDLADMVLEQVTLAHVSPGDIDERWVETLRQLVGADRWNEAMALFAGLLP